ncbi:MAG: membrane protein insertion efficiency factor YidD [bacterium]
MWSSPGPIWVTCLIPRVRRLCVPRSKHSSRRPPVRKEPFSVKRALLLLLGVYQRWISPAFPRRCKYEPTCSRYAVEAVSELGPLKGSILASWRLLRCNPLSNGGIDDVADRTLFRADRPRNSCGHGPSGAPVR